MKKIRGAMAYPVIVLVVMIAVVGFMLVKVLPQVQILYKGIPGTHLPIETALLLDVSLSLIHISYFNAQSVDPTKLIYIGNNANPAPFNNQASQ